MHYRITIKYGNGDSMSYSESTDESMTEVMDRLHVEHGAWPEVNITVTNEEEMRRLRMREDAEIAFKLNMIVGEWHDVI